MGSCSVEVLSTPTGEAESLRGGNFQEGAAIGNFYIHYIIYIPLRIQISCRIYHAVEETRVPRPSVRGSLAILLSGIRDPGIQLCHSSIQSCECSSSSFAEKELCSRIALPKGTDGGSVRYLVKERSDYVHEPKFGRFRGQIS